MDSLLRTFPTTKLWWAICQDNSPGVPGIGEVSATAVLEECGSLDKVYEDLDVISTLPFRGAKRVGRLLAEHWEQAFLIRILTTIVCDVPVDIDIDGAMLEESGLEAVEALT